MAAAVLQGVPVTTSDIDFWIGTPENEHDAVLIICNRLGANILTDHVVELPDGSQLNFAYTITGLKTFDYERRRSAKIRWLGENVRLLSLAQIEKSKRAVGRPKDKVHLLYLQQAIAMIKRKK